MYTSADNGIFYVSYITNNNKGDSYESMLFLSGLHAYTQQGHEAYANVTVVLKKNVYSGVCVISVQQMISESTCHQTTLTVSLDAHELVRKKRKCDV